MTLGARGRKRLELKKRNAALAAAFPKGILCQKCLQYGHWSYECKAKRKVLVRPSVTQIMKRKLKSDAVGCSNGSCTMPNKKKNCSSSESKSSCKDSSSGSDSRSGSSGSSSSSSNSSSDGSESESESNDSESNDSESNDSESNDPESNDSESNDSESNDSETESDCSDSHPAARRAARPACR